MDVFFSVGHGDFVLANRMTRDSYLFPGILGTTGSGKSTILSLILRLYEPSSGQILLDGRDIKEYNPLWLRHHIGFVSQDDATISCFLEGHVYQLFSYA